MHGSITYKIISAGLVAPDMAEVEIVTYLVSSRSSQVELGIERVIPSSEGVIVDHYTVRRKGTAWELRIA